MAQVDLSINGHNYQIACDDGQESHLLRLAGEVEKRVQRLVSSVGQVGNARLLLMASLLLADEMSEGSAAGKLSFSPEDEALAGEIESLVSRIETLAVRMRRS